MNQQGIIDARALFGLSEDLQNNLVMDTARLWAMKVNGEVWGECMLECRAFWSWWWQMWNATDEQLTACSWRDGGQLYTEIHGERLRINDAALYYTYAHCDLRRYVPNETVIRAAMRIYKSKTDAAVLDHA